MSAQVINFPTPAPLPETVYDTTCRVISYKGEEFSVERNIDTATRRGYEAITHTRTGTFVILRSCGDGEDPRIAEMVITGWLAGWRLGWMRGREALCNEIVDPELQ